MNKDKYISSLNKIRASEKFNIKSPTNKFWTPKRIFYFATPAVAIVLVVALTIGFFIKHSSGPIYHSNSPTTNKSLYLDRTPQKINTPTLNKSTPATTETPTTPKRTTPLKLQLLHLHSSQSH